MSCRALARAIMDEKLEDIDLADGNYGGRRAPAPTVKVRLRRLVT